MVGRHSELKDPNHEWRLRLRSLNEATSCLPRAKQTCFRPTHSIWPHSDNTTRINALFLANYVFEHEQELLDTINVHCLIALVSADVSSFRKTHILNLMIKWLLQNQVEAPMLHHILQSILAPYLTLRRLGRVRLGIYIYLTTSELISYYDIYYEHSGSICIKRKSNVPGDPAVYDDSDLLCFCKAVNKITDDYYNPCWPEGTYRKDPDAPTIKKGKLKYSHRPPIGVKPSELLNPCFRWDFKNRGTRFAELREPVPHFPQIDRHTILSHDPRAALKKYRDTDHQEEHQQEAEEKIVEQACIPKKLGIKSVFDFSPLPKKLERLTGHYQKSKLSMLTKTTSSGYGSITGESNITSIKSGKDILTDFKKCTIRGSHETNSQASSSYSSTHPNLGKIPVNTRPGGSKHTGYQPRNRWNQGNWNCQGKFNNQKNKPNWNPFQNSQPSDHQQQRNRVPIEETKASKKPVIPSVKISEKPAPKFSFDPIRKVIQQNY